MIPMAVDVKGNVRNQPEATSELSGLARSSLGIFFPIGAISCVSNLLTLTGPVFMLEVYDRVLPSRSIPTLIGLSVLAVLLYGFQGALELVRSRTLVRVGNWIDESLHDRVYEIIVKLPLKATSGAGDGLQPLRDLDQVRAFLSGSGPAALFDLPWIPVYLGICFIFHFWIGMTATVGALVLVVLTLFAEFMSRGPVKVASQTAAKRGQLAAAGRRNAEVIQAMGMWHQLTALYGAANDEFVATQRRAADVTGGLGGLARVLRMILQSAVLGVGGFLVIRQEATAGIIIASSILSARALSPVDLVIANWKGLVSARQSWHRLDELLRHFAPAEPPMRFPEPRTSLAIESVAVVPPGGTTPVVYNINFELKAGQALGVIGPSGSGKSSLARALVGVWSAAGGFIRIDGGTFEHWGSAELGRHIGYLPQDVELFDGTVAENIARFEKGAASELILAAAKAAGVHQLIQTLPDGYKTRVGEAGVILSAGQRQRIALARALYRDPFLVVLDEPNSNLDADGDQALTSAILGVRARGGIAVIVAHRPSAIAGVDYVLMMKDGLQVAFGPKDQTLASVLRPGAAMPLAAADQKVERRS